LTPDPRKPPRFFFFFAAGPPEKGTDPPPSPCWGFWKRLFWFGEKVFLPNPGAPPPPPWGDRTTPPCSCGKPGKGPEVPQFKQKGPPPPRPPKSSPPTCRVTACVSLVWPFPPPPFFPKCVGGGFFLFFFPPVRGNGEPPPPSRVGPPPKVGVFPPEENPILFSSFFTTENKIEPPASLGVSAPTVVFVGGEIGLPDRSHPPPV